jgi:hypothetical protein
VKNLKLLMVKTILSVPLLLPLCWHHSNFYLHFCGCVVKGNVEREKKQKTIADLSLLNLVAVIC